ncbi:hypothetical protein PHYBLDRAFT_176054 [Phycomyces blakesleeanus NRRL 1555(-)]|uniref:Uncharacterized protein n=1 Tax=Phycomyces blakesleeanus (strain ATCC 8743b / DSM 1359 / FGSC 10004 / NBRC 33097 / NRRL 1555) TaxID=763407 RepID=A0A162W8W2_PHYB8|nr:hypothetical protein PHYBLDRAFT_176054 [Phycomyces blakesleeanus NRRL 1555(-)]OAD65455.1 hypothetical protein PHYBLDRAFT_176054 [Phycomyces blakesleeanus NRRL 1555(-)]|eukprot:XP_018283495.1 hypothetical protein PHYBLDRAFT_176054 [Phycomyces blakesleeanus NRRL 1555(-)]
MGIGHFFAVTVNHNVEYVISDGIHINTIEGLRNGIKMNCKTRLRTKQMRKKYENRLWQGMLKKLAEVSFGSIVDNPIYTNYEYLEDDEDEEYTDSTMSRSGISFLALVTKSQNRYHWGSSSL